MSRFQSHLRIDTSISSVAGPSSGSRNQSSSQPMLSPLGSSFGNRARTNSNASSSSTLSLISPTSSSTNASSSSLSVSEVTYAPHDSPLRSASLDLDETLGPMSDYVLAMHDYTPQHQNATCLSFKAGQVIHVLNRDVSGWWDGELEGRRGWFPSNYVNLSVDEDEEEEDATEIPVRPQTHMHTKSTASAKSWSPSTLQHPHSLQEALGPDIDSYCPPLMVPLLHGLSLLQNAVRANRVNHFQPSTACIISCVRSILSATDTLSRDGPILQQFPVLAQERRGILAVLASLVAQAKRASEGYVHDETHEFEVDAMLRLGGQVFAHVRRFLAVAVQCGVELPERRHSSSFSSGSVDVEGQACNYRNVPHNSYNGNEPHRISPISRAYPRDASVSPTHSLRAKSMSELRSRPNLDHSNYLIPVLPSRSLDSETCQDNLPIVPPRTLRRHRPAISSSSSSSYSSLESSATPSLSPFPSGPCTTSQVTETLRSTHDHYLSTIAAFIGHAHSYSRSSHASSTGHMYDLVREIVEMVCKLLTIVEAVLSHPDAPNNRIVQLKSAKDGLYRVTSSLAESVRLLNMPLPSSTTDEEEKRTLLRAATGALKAGADCVAAVKICLSRSLGESPFILQVPTLEVPAPQLFKPGEIGGHPVSKSISMIELNGHQMDDDDRPLQNGLLGDESSGSESSSAMSKSSSVFSGVTNLTTPDGSKCLSPIIVSQSPVEHDLGSLSSLIRTDEDETTWEGSVHTLPRRSVEDKMINGDLPVLPSEAFQQTPEFPPSPIGWLLSHDYALDDVAYNGDGHLVGATLDVLVEKMTPHDSIVDAAFSAVFFLTFRLFCTPVELAQALIKRYTLEPPNGISEQDLQLWHQQKILPIRMRVSNFIKSWVEIYWRTGADDSAIPELVPFVSATLRSTFQKPAERILGLLDVRSTTKDLTISPKGGDRVRDPGMSINPPTIVPASEIPRPTMTKTLLAALRARNFTSISITDFHPLELARQLTIMECNLYCAIQPEEILESGQEGAKHPVNVRALTSLSTVITGWVAESILNEHDIKKRTALIKFFIKVADRCSLLHNYSTPRSMLAALDSSTISRLRQTWMGLPQKNRLQLEAMRRLADHGRNYHEYRTKLRNTAPPAVPFLGLYLTDVTFCREGNPSHRVSPLNADKKLLNFNKYHKLARIVQDMQRFQSPYNLKAIPEVQAYLNYVFENSRHHGDLQDLYRRSLLVEPKEPADTLPSGDLRHIFNWRSQPPSKVLTQPTLVTS
ncbi:ras guanine nucleotide exchange factor domain-containing protein [Desarmillaria ectypa]|nr:ras guanine nucleotide exchange factor domain-containing protein [Desarmillaria ectypa]